MAVIVKYVVVRDGEEKMTFATKKEADAYDRMLDIADNLYIFFKAEDFELDERQMEDISLKLAREKDNIMKILKGGKIPAKESQKKESSKDDITQKESPPPKNTAAQKTRGKKSSQAVDTKKKVDKNEEKENPGAEKKAKS